MGINWSHLPPEGCTVWPIASSITPHTVIAMKSNECHVSRAAFFVNHSQVILPKCQYLSVVAQSQQYLDIWYWCLFDTVTYFISYTKRNRQLGNLQNGMRTRDKNKLKKQRRRERVCRYSLFVIELWELKVICKR